MYVLTGVAVAVVAVVAVSSVVAAVRQGQLGASPLSRLAPSGHRGDLAWQRSPALPAPPYWSGRLS
jgi:hypothetical protein